MSVFFFLKQFYTLLFETEWLLSLFKLFSIFVLIKNSLLNECNFWKMPIVHFTNLNLKILTMKLKLSKTYFQFFFFFFGIRQIVCRMPRHCRGIQTRDYAPAARRHLNTVRNSLPSPWADLQPSKNVPSKNTSLMAVTIYFLYFIHPQNIRKKSCKFLRNYDYYKEKIVNLWNFSCFNDGQR